MFLGVDIGSSRTKGVLVRPDGSVVAVALRSHDISYPHPGWAEQDAETVWWAEVAGVARELTARYAGQIDGVCVAGLGPCLLVADADDRPLRPAILYGIDTRAGIEIGELTARFGEPASGPLSAQSVAPKLLWIRRHEPDVWSRASRMLTAHSYGVLRLTGSYALDHHSASSYAPLYDTVRHDWDLDAAAEVAPGMTLPHLLWSSEVVGTVSSDAEAATGIPRGTPVAMGAFDAWLDAASVGVKDPGDRLLNYGSTTVLITVTSQKPAGPCVRATPGVFPGTATVAVGTAASGALTKWFGSIVGDVPLEALLDEASRMPAGADGLIVLPYFAGERAPISDPRARGLIVGLTLGHGRGHLFRALLEATAFAARDLLVESGRCLTSPPGPLKAAGAGGSRGLWTQIVSDVTGQEQLLSRVTLGACYGAAWLAGVARGSVSASTSWNEVVDTVRPDPRNVAVYDRLYRVYRDLYPATAGAMHQLADFDRGTSGMAEP